MKTRRILFIIGCLCWFGSASLVYKYDKPIQKRYTIHNKYTQISGKSGQTVTYYFYLGNNEEKEVTRITYNSFNTGDWVAFKDRTNEYEIYIDWLFCIGGISLFISFIIFIEFITKNTHF